MPLTQKEVNAEIEKLGNPQPNDEKSEKQLTKIRMGKPKKPLKSKKNALQFIISHVEKCIALIDKGDALVQANKELQNTKAQYQKIATDLNKATTYGDVQKLDILIDEEESKGKKISFDNTYGNNWDLRVFNQRVL